MKVPQFMPFVGKEEYRAIKQCFDTNWITEGPLSKQFSEGLREEIGVDYGAFAPNGTLALVLALKALGIGPGDEVIVPSVTFLASATSVEFLGATPVFVDVDENVQLDLNDVKRVMTPKTKAIMPVHLFGFTPDMDGILEFAKAANLLVIEDAAQAFGIRYKDRGCGSFGDAATFSFFADKTLTTAEGGFVTTNREDVHEKLLYLRNQGRKNRGSFIHPELGYNFRMTDIQSAMGLAQLKKFNTLVEKKQAIHKKYAELFDGFEHIEVFHPPDYVTKFIPFRVIIKTKNDEADLLMDHMRENGVEPRMFFYPMHLQPAFDYLKEDPRYHSNNFPVSERLYANGVCLPSFVAIKPQQIRHVVKVIKSFYNSKKEKAV